MRDTTSGQRANEVRAVHSDLKMAISKEELSELYLNQQLSIPEIAKRYSLHHSTLWYYTKKYGIPRRSRSESLKIAYKQGRKQSNIVKPDLSPSPTLAYIVGVMLGDGHIEEYKKHYRIRLNTVDLDFAKSFQSALETIGVYSKIYYRTKLSKQSSGWSLRGYSKAFCEWCKSLTFDEIVKIAELYPKDFIRGFYESEGAFYETGRSYQIRIANTNKELIMLVKKLIERLGSKTSLYEEIRERKPIYRIYILGGMEQRLRFINEIQPCIKRG
jgi:hypothetical protein